jgi:uncharacterized delta-60 repeat protein
MNRILLTLSFFLLIFTYTFSQVDPQFRPVISDFPQIYATAIQPDGKVLVGGNKLITGNLSPQPLLRLNPDGSRDILFNPPTVSENNYVTTIALDNNGKIMVGGGTSDYPRKPVVWRLNSDGSTDPTFVPTPQINDNVYQILPFPDGGYLIFSSSLKPIIKIKSNGELDASFNAGAGPDSYGMMNGDIAIQPDGKILVAGLFSTFSGTAANRIVRLNPNGSIDNTFSIGTGLSGGYRSIKSIVLDGDKIILAGSFTSFNSVPAVNIVRLLSTGQVDPNFAYPGPSSNHITYSIDQVELHAGGILLAGLKHENNAFYFSLMKLKLDGSLEAMFPLIQGDVSVNAGAIWPPLLTTAGSKILISGYFDKISSVSKRGMAIFNEDGSIEPSFSPSVGGTANIWASKIQADGKILIGGSFNHVGDTYINNLVRLNPDGSIDQVFRSNLGIGFNRSVYSIEIQTNGKILVGGGFDKLNGVDKRLMIRLNEDGTVDNTFNTALNLQSVGPGVNEIIVLPSGKILIGGAFFYLNNTDMRNNLARLNENGSIDPTFNQTMLTYQQRVNSIAIQSDNHLLIGGPDNQDGFMKRTTFDGVVENIFPAINLTSFPVQLIKVLPNDNFLMTGYPTSSWGPTTPNPLFQFNKDGVLLDKLSVAVYDGNVLDIKSIDTESIILAGTFKSVNNFPVRSLAKVKLNGSVESLFNYTVNGDIFNMEKDNNPYNSFYLMGRFFSVDNLQTFHLAKINFDVPNKPVDLVYSADNVEGKIFLEWKDKSFNETGFNIFRSEGPGFITIGSVASGVIKFTDSTASPLKSYTYKVGASNVEFQSPFSNTVDVSTSGWVPPLEPTQLTYTIATDFESALIKWTDGSTNEKGFHLERSMNGAEYAPLVTLQKNTVSYADELNIGNLHRYRVRAFNKFGVSGYTNIVALPIMTELPEESATELVVYPNPTVDKICVSQKTPAPMIVTIYDSTGKLQHIQTGKDATMELNVSEMQHGLYVVKVLKGNRFETFKVVKTK